MNVFLKASALALITIVLYLVVSKQNKDISILIAVTGCCSIILAALTYFNPVINFINKLRSIGSLNNDLLNTILKAVGIGLIAEIMGLICSDAGNSSLGKSIHILATAVMLWISLPVFNQLIDLINQILGTI